MHFLYTLSILIALVSPETKRKPKLVWSDEFNYNGLPDASRWSYHVGDGCPGNCGWGNNELQFYTKEDSANARVRDGKLIIEAHKKSVAGKTFTSARIISKADGNWKYGYIEIKAKLPTGRGTWPAIWMLPETFKYGGWPASGEIDVMEHVGYDPGVVHGTVHTEAFNHSKGTQVGKQKMVTHFDSNFHTYAVNWTKDKIEFYIDGRQYHVFENQNKGFEEWPFDHPFYLIMNIAVGGGWGGKQGVDESIWPQQMQIDYVRVYEPLQTEKQKASMLTQWSK